jgi:hypothetical protein
MRVSRRTRPSQVGCGSATARRRLQHTQTHDTQSRTTPPDQASPTQVTMIRIGFVEAWETLGVLPWRSGVDPQSDHASIVARSRARGR